MSVYTDRAVALFREGYNCAQAVFAAFHDRVGLSEETALRVALGLGGGVGRMREVCGAICGAAMLAGMVCGANDPKDRAAKALAYQKVQEIAEQFRKTNPSIVCRELLGLSKATPQTSVPQPRTEAYYQKRPCVQIVEDAARAVEQVLFTEQEDDHVLPESCLY